MSDNHRILVAIAFMVLKRYTMSLLTIVKRNIMKELYLMALDLHCKGKAKDLKQLSIKTQALLDYLRSGLTSEERIELAKNELNISNKL